MKILFGKRRFSQSMQSLLDSNLQRGLWHWKNRHWNIKLGSYADLYIRCLLNNMLWWKHALTYVIGELQCCYGNRARYWLLKHFPPKCLLSLFFFVIEWTKRNISAVKVNAGTLIQFKSNVFTCVPWTDSQAPVSEYTITLINFYSTH